MAFTNNNVCRNFKKQLHATNWTQLSAQECSEILVVGPAGGCLVSDGAGLGDPSTATAFRVPADVVVTFRGLTNANQLSAVQDSGSAAAVYWRTQYYSSMVVAVG